ncbi:MAG: alpha-L-fucosidase [Anaerorhabdus sp.]
MKKLIEQIPSLVASKHQKEQVARKFGMFIHFGINTFGNVQWSDGSIDPRVYKPSKINAEQWVKTAYDAGMEYVIITAKHHDGFCLWDTDSTTYSVNNSGNKTDVVFEVYKNCKKYGIKLAIYYSLWDRKEETYKNDFDNGYIPYMLNHLKELLGGRYGEVVEVWFDGAWDKPRSKWRLDLVYDQVKRLQPKCQVGINLTVGIDDDTACTPPDRYMPLNTQENDPLRMYPSDFRLWDPYCCRADDPKIYTYGGKRYYLPFEMTICSREGSSWFYSNIYEEEKLLDANDVANKCKLCFNSDNLAVINMAPNTEGSFVQEDIDNLMKVAKILKVYREK